ncbi:MAG: 2-C-methyl-D-erythritol 4-phosphate cytidylyltransferase [Pyrinomonadaceae bacterium]
MNAAIIVAAGSGKRFGADVPKQFLEILGKPLIVHTLEKFESCLLVDEIILVLPFEEIKNFQTAVEKYNLRKLVKIIAGGATRAESVLNGMNSIDEDKTEIIAVHDGARPLVSTEEISRTIKRARETGAACLVAAVTDTIKKVADGKIKGTIDRAKLRRALTPQAFRYEILKRAFEAADLSETATDECFLVEKLGCEISVVEGSAENFKITTPEDFALAEIFLSKSANRKSQIENV